MTQTDLGRAVGISRAAISQIESGESKGMRPENLLAAADALVVDVYELVRGAPRRKAKIPDSPAAFAHRLIVKLADALANGQLSGKDEALLAAMIDAMIFAGASEKPPAPPPGVVIQRPGSNATHSPASQPARKRNR